MYSYKDLCKAQIGTKVTFEGGIKRTLLKTDEDRLEDGFDMVEIENLKDMRDNTMPDNLGKIIKIEEPVYTTVYEVKEILDEEEKEYLSAVIKPSSIRNNVRCIVKHEDYWNGMKLKEYLYIASKDCYTNGITTFGFDKGSMYKNMELDKEYTLEELGL